MEKCGFENMHAQVGGHRPGKTRETERQAEFAAKGSTATRHADRNPSGEEADKLLSQLIR